LTTWLTSDLHLGHIKAIELCNRPWFTTTEMNEAIIQRYNSVVAEGDTVYCLGDMVMGQLSENLPMLSRLNGTKLLILGNHDRPSQAYHHKKIEVWWNIYQSYFPVMMEEMRLDIGPNGEEILFNHFPYADPDYVDHAEAGRFAKLQPKNEGEWLIHGHVHGAWKVNGKQINVGVDAWDYYPVPLDTILNMIKENPNGFSRS